MRLKQLKLAGFKSFVDTTIIPFPSQLVAVVGPNGCGKSNIIDAVRWVMGESQAKQLRGESITDVIFKGSSTRKSIGQASVELIFDNQMGRLSGPYASYQEIAVKRLVTLDGDSTYFLNGTRCRRRDITDLFLGTGAGARGYSIIGQDTISRLIEARPEELRAYLEEAAGVSKYKERRRETLQRIAHTRENLARVTDIQIELEKQLARLERQAQAAQRYITLKQQERQCKTEVLALKYRALSQESDDLNAQTQQLAQTQESHQTEIASSSKKAEIFREELMTQQDFNQTLQMQFYQLATEMARLEETIQQQAREKQQLTLDHQQWSTDFEHALQQLTQQKDALRDADQSIQSFQTELDTLQQQITNQQQALHQDEQLEAQWNLTWHSVINALHESEKASQLAKMRLQHLQERHQQLQLTFEKYQIEQEALDIGRLQQELSQLEVQYLDDQVRHAQLVEESQQSTREGAQLRDQLLGLEHQLHQLHDQTKALAIEYAALLATQQAALKATPNDLSLWNNKPRVAELISVDEAWMAICEVILGEVLQAIVVDSIDELWSIAPPLQGQTLSFVENSKSAGIHTAYPRLIDKIQGILPANTYDLASIYIAETLTEGLNWLPNLSANQSIVTQEGYWFGPGWLRLLNLAPDDQLGVLARKEELSKLSVKLGVKQKDLEQLTEQRNQLHQQIITQEQTQAHLKEQLTIQAEVLRLSESQFQQKKHVHTQNIKRQAVLNHELQELQFTIENCLEEHFEASNQVEKATLQQAELVLQQQQLLADKSVWEIRLANSRQQLNELNNACQQNRLQLNQSQASAQYLRTQNQREEQRIDVLKQRLEGLNQRLLECNQPVIDQQALLAHKLTEHAAIETQLALGRQKADEIQQQLQQVEQITKQKEQKLKQLQEKLQQMQLQAQSLATRKAGQIELLQELDAEWRFLLDNLSDESTIDNREQYLLSLDDKIKRLGAINLLAIEEYQADLERKQQLDSQYQDLTEALYLLERAIAKMDKETEQRLRETFDQVNASFQALFPQLFGGGQASLELTSNNLLEAGVLVMAQPPGKRNNTIYMLSGGEKAMTAVALVFAIFQLNPSPFCMLDEVDAPLDEANVRRFCELVKDMSQVVQFLFITHNKVTMELADHLIGVTMREPGVSRIVAVDVCSMLSVN